MSDGPAIDVDDVRAARERIADAIHRTPVLRSHQVDAAAGRSLFFKCENLQRTGSFKIRGATNRLRSLSAEERRRGVVAFSSGNHAQAVALAARERGVDAKIVMPADAPRSKRAATEGYGATVVEYGPGEDREAIARRLVEEEGRVLVPPFDDPFVMAGQGTAALELLEEVPELDAVVVPVGGGGLLAGTSTATMGHDPPVPAWGAEPAAGDDVARSLETGRIVRIPLPDTIADGARTESTGERVFPVLQARVAGIVRVPDDALVRAMALLLTRMKILVEPTGALAAAAMLEGLLPADLKRVGVILSGGNINAAMLARVLAEAGA